MNVMGRISSADFGSELINISLVVSSMMKASLYPVNMPLLIDIFPSDNFVPFSSIFFFIDNSIGFNITQFSELQ